MFIYNSVKTRKGFQNIPVSKVSHATLNDTVFLLKEEIEDAVFLSEVNMILAKQNLVLVTSAARECSTGSYRCFIGDANYVSGTLLE